MNAKRRKALFLGFSFSEAIKQDIKKTMGENWKCVFETASLRYAIYDFNPVFINLKYFNSQRTIKWIYERREEIKRTLESGKSIALFYDAPRRIGAWNNYEWLAGIDYAFYAQIRDGLHVGMGDNLIPCKDSEYYRFFKDIFENFEFEWYADLYKPISYEKIKDIDTLAMSGGNCPVAFILEFKEKYGSGRLAFLPYLKEENKHKIKSFYVTLFRGILNLPKVRAKGPTKKYLEEPSPTPNWIENYNFPGELKLEKQQREVEEKLAQLKNAKRILYERGKILPQYVGTVFKKLDYDTTVKETLESSEGREDIKIEFEDFIGIIDVKSVLSKDKQYHTNEVYKIIGQIGNYTNQYLQQGKPCKEIVIISHDLEKEPKKRRPLKDFFTKEALEAIQNKDICVISTVQLFEIYRRMIELKGKIKDLNEFKECIRRKFKETKGILKETFDRNETRS